MFQAAPPVPSARNGLRPILRWPCSARVSHPPPSPDTIGVVPARRSRATRTRLTTSSRSTRRCRASRWTSRPGADILRRCRGGGVQVACLSIAPTVFFFPQGAQCLKIIFVASATCQKLASREVPNFAIQMFPTHLDCEMRLGNSVFLV